MKLNQRQAIMLFNLMLEDRGNSGNNGYNVAEALRAEATQINDDWRQDGLAFFRGNIKPAASVLRAIADALEVDDGSVLLSDEPKTSDQVEAGVSDMDPVMEDRTTCAETQADPEVQP